MNAFEILKQRFQQAQCNHTDQDKFPHGNLKIKLTKCAVLVLFYRQDKQFHLLLSIRSAHLKNYPDEICYPGGKCESQDEDSYEKTALREAHEEIGIERENVKIVCKLCPFPTIAGCLIAPVIGLVCTKDGNYEDTQNIIDSLKFNPNEVQSLFSVPLSYFRENLNKAFSILKEPLKVKFFKSINPLGELNDRIPNEFLRPFVHLNETVFDHAHGRFPYLYGFNAYVLLYVLFLVESKEEQGNWLELHAESIFINRSNIIQFVDQIRICSYLIYLKEKIRKSKL